MTQATGPVRPYRGVSATDRRVERRRRLVEASLDVVGDAGVASATVEAICEQAGLTKRYFYESFADRDALFVSVIDEVFADVRDDILAALAAAEPTFEARTLATADALVRALDRDRRRARLYVEAPAHPALHARRDEAVGTFAQLLVDEVLGVPADDPRATVVALVVVAGTTEAVSRWLAGEIALDRDELVTEITRIGIALGS